MAIVVLAILVLAVIGILWWLVFRAAMHHPNNGNDLSRDELG